MQQQQGTGQPCWPRVEPTMVMLGCPVMFLRSQVWGLISDGGVVLPVHEVIGISSRPRRRPTYHYVDAARACAAA